MEIESKFIVDNPADASKLKALDTIPGYTLSEVMVLELTDDYIDTPDRKIITAMKVLRERKVKDGPTIYTLKWDECVEGAMHRRGELEIEVDGPLPPSLWPEGELRDMVIGIVGFTKLDKQFGIKQVRHLRNVIRDGSVVAEFSVDEITMTSGDEVHHSIEVEIEKKCGGTEDDLHLVVGCLKKVVPLTEQPRSKFERALEFFR